MAALPLYTKRALLVSLLAIIVFLVFENGPVRLPLHIDGHIDSRFERVKLVFTQHYNNNRSPRLLDLIKNEIQNFIDGWERGGASLTIYEHGKKVVDIWGGYADRAALRKWKEDTLQVVFSTTKGIGAVCIAMLIDRGHASYDDLVIKHWPEFGKNGKENITIQMVLSHAAGLTYFDEDLTIEQAQDPKVIGNRIENQKPHWPPGTRSGYHIYTHGWLVDQLIRRIDPKKRSIGQFVKEEIHDAYDVDFYIGIPKEEVGRVARLTAPSTLDRLSEVMTDFRVIKYFKALFNLISDSMLSRALNNIGWLECVYQMTVNNPDYWRIEQSAALGIGNARSLAKIFSLVGEKKLISSSTLDLLHIPHYNDSDLMMGDAPVKGNGLFFTPLNRGKSPSYIGHTGHGCQQVMLDIGNGLSIAYTNNALKTALGDLCRTWKRLQDSIYDSLDL